MTEFWCDPQTLDLAHWLCDSFVDHVAPESFVTLSYMDERALSSRGYPQNRARKKTTLKELKVMPSCLWNRGLLTSSRGLTTMSSTSSTSTSSSPRTLSPADGCSQSRGTVQVSVDMSCEYATKGCQRTGARVNMDGGELLNHHMDHPSAQFQIHFTDLTPYLGDYAVHKHDPFVEAQSMDDNRHTESISKELTETDVPQLMHFAARETIQAMRASSSSDRRSCRKRFFQSSTLQRTGDQEESPGIVTG